MNDKWGFVRKARRGPDNFSKQKMLEIEVLHEFETEFSADSVEWCHQDSFKNCFAVGTYQLEEKNADDSSRNTRKGKIYLFEYDEADNKLTKLQEISTDAILDQKWMIVSYVYTS